MNNLLTAHCVIKNEPFVWYSVMSVYDYVDRILLYDTGSNDAYTLKDIHDLVQLDKSRDKKIVFKRVAIETDETTWTHATWHREMKANAAKKLRGVGHVRLEQIQDTTTKFFMVLDGDEVQYDETMELISATIKNWPAGKICGFIPLDWYSEIDKVFHQSASGRVFLTDEIGMRVASPGELHTVKKTNAPLGPGSVECFKIGQVLPYAHFETMLKPWRRKVPPQHVKPAPRPLPKVMQDRPDLIERFINASQKG